MTAIQLNVLKKNKHPLHPSPPCIHAHVVFGEPSNHCKGSGICEVFVVPANHRSKCCDCPNQLSGTISYDELERTLSFRFLTLTVPDNLYKELFNASTFLMNEDWPATHELYSSCYLPAFSLKKGVYPIVKSDKFIEILFPID